MESRTREYERRPQHGGPGIPGGDGLSALREEGDRMLAASDAAIERTLSGNPEGFLLANRQHGGQ